MAFAKFLEKELMPMDLKEVLGILRKGDSYECCRSFKLNDSIWIIINKLISIYCNDHILFKPKKITAITLVED